MFRRPRRSRSGPVDTFASLREQVFGADAAGVAPAPTPDHPNVWGAVMEMSYPNGTASLIALSDGTTSLYTSTGGGVVGGGAHTDVVTATHGFLSSVEQHLGLLSLEEGTPLPGIGSVRIHALTLSGRLAGEAAEDELGQDRHELSSVFHAGHRVITALRLIEEAGRSPAS
jgi:hypothetical protein